MPQPQEVRRYFAASPPKAGSVLRELQGAIRAAAPDAVAESRKAL